MKNHKNSILIVLILLLGFSGLIIQLTFLRELLGLFSGNELSIGLIFGNWLLINGLGAFMAKYFSRFFKSVIHLNLLQLLQVFLALVMLFASNYFRFLFFEYGSDVGLLSVFFFSFLILFPVSFISGGLFTFYSSFYSKIKKGNKIAFVYSLESLGSVLGGSVFSFILVYYLLPFEIISIVFIINLTASIIILLDKRRIVLASIIASLLLGLVALHIISSPDKLMKKNIFIGQDILEIRESPFGQLVVTKSDDQINLFENGIPISSSHQVIEMEELVHFGMSQHDNPKNVLLISGGNSRIIDEVFKYPVEQVDYVDINAQLVELKSKYDEQFSMKDELNVIYKDPRIFITETKKKYDIVLVNISDPVNVQLNRYYTKEFFSDIDLILKSNGIIQISLSDPGVFMNNTSIQIHSAVFNSLQSVFSNVKLYSSSQNFFIGAQSLLPQGILDRVSEINLNNEYFNEYYLDEDGINLKGQQIINRIDKNSQINTDKWPMTYFLFGKRWLTYHHQPLYYFILLLLIPFIILFFIIKNKNKIPLALSGFTSSAFQMILILIFQIYFGYIYQMLGVFFIVFMIGLAMGVGFVSKLFIHRKYSVIVCQLWFFFLIMMLLIVFHFDMMQNSSLTFFLIFILNFSSALFTGIQFSIASQEGGLSISEKGANIYSADLLGSTIGALLITSMIIPLLGFEVTLVVLGLLNLFAYFLIKLKKA